MATNTFDNAGSATNLYETADDWSLGHIPEATDDVVIAVDCTVSTDESAVACASLTINNAITLTVANGADIRFTAASTITGSLTAAATSAVYFTDCNLTITVTTGSLECDGGIINFVTTGATTYYLYVNGSFTGTTNANGTTDINASVSAQDKFIVRNNNTAATISGLSAAKRLGITLNAGASVGRSLQLYGHQRGCSYIHLVGSRLGIESSYRGNTVTGCDIEDGTYGMYFGTDILVRDTFIHGCTTGISSTFGLLMIGGALGQTPAAGSDANTTDFDNTNGSISRFFNVIWETEAVNLAASVMISTMHDGDAELFARWDGNSTTSGYGSHITRSEMTTVHDSSRQSIKIVTASGTTSASQMSYEFLLAAWPATHGDTLDVTLYVRGQSGDKFQVHVDPESNYGTTQTTEHTQSVNDTWELVTVAQYTVNTNASEQMGIPIVILCEEASKTWYIDTLSVNGVTVSLDFGAYGGRPTRDQAGAAAGGAPLITTRRNTMIGR